MAGYDDSVASRGFSYAPAGYQPRNDLTGIGQAMGTLVQGALTDPATDPKRAQARLYNADAALKERQFQGGDELSSVMQNLSASVAADPANAGKIIYATGIKYGYDPKDLANLMQGMAGAGGADEATMRNLRAGTGASPLGENESLTLPGQNNIRAGNFAQEKSMQTLKNSAPQEGPKVNFGDVANVDKVIEATRGDKVLTPEGFNAVSKAAIQGYKGGMDPVSSVSQAMQDSVVPQKEDRFDFGTGLRDRTVYVPKDAAQPAAPVVNPGVNAAVPPAAQRVTGQTYPTPKGPMTWTGTGWLPGA